MLAVTTAAESQGTILLDDIRYSLVRARAGDDDAHSGVAGAAGSRRRAHDSRAAAQKPLLMIAATESIKISTFDQ
jgi:hypothetical protein